MRNGRLALAAALFGLTLMACGGGTGPGSQHPASRNTSTALRGRVAAAGSTALLPLIKLAADEFQDAHGGVTVSVSGGGSFTGLKLVAEGAVDIGMSDVELPADLQGKGLVDTRVCIAPLLIIVNKDVSVDSLTREQLVAIFTARVANWQGVGGKDQPITIIHRAASSGSRETIRATVLKGREFTDKAAIQDSNGAVRTAVAGTPGAIGYIDAAYLDASIKALKYSGVAYSPEAVRGGRYPVFAYEHLYTRGQPVGVARAFIDHVMGPAFQRSHVGRLGFVPLAG